MSKEKELLESYVTWREIVENIKKNLSESQAKLDECERSLRRYMEESGVESTAKYEELGRFSLGSPIVNVKFDKDNYPIEYAIDWCKQNGFSDAVRETIHHATLGSIVKSVIDEGKAVPEYFILSTFRPSKYTKGV